MIFRLKNPTDLERLVKNIRIRSDVLGSYTGTPENGGRPVQDADDL